MSYQPRPNASGDTLNASRDQIRTNFQIINTDFQVNHVAFDLVNEGKHKFLQMPDQGAAPATAANEGGFYVKDASGSNLFFRSESNGEEYQMTRVSDANIATFATNTAYAANHTGGWTFLAGGLILQYGLRSSPGTSGTVTLPRAFPNALFSVTTATERNNSASNQSVHINNANPIGPATFTYNNTSSSSNFYWQAIGN